MTNPVTATSNVAATAQTARSESSASARGASFAAVHAAAVSDGKEKAKDAVKDATTAPSTPKGERTASVAGRSYDEIVGGPRNGMFVNDSGNARDGQAFVMVKRGGREFHIYGTGRDRAVFEVGRDESRDATPAPAAGAPAGTTGTPASTPAASSPTSG
ncbi:MAG: hypothetical protein QOC64_542 [Solirubrobacteraceae bacterium]|nr:hypothetical protein [Solirubrobacteraceae bacterium]